MHRCSKFLLALSLWLCANVAAAQGAPVVVNHRVVHPDTTGEGDDVVEETRFEVRATPDGVTVGATRGRRTTRSNCERRAEGDFHPAAGPEALYACDSAAGLYALRAEAGGLRWAGILGAGGELQTGDLTGDGRLELVTSGRYEFSAAMGDAWGVSVFTFEETAPRSIYQTDDVDDAMGGDSPTHRLTLRPAEGSTPAALIHVQTGGMSAGEYTLVYDPVARSLREAPAPAPGGGTPSGSEAAYRGSLRSAHVDGGSCRWTGEPGGVRVRCEPTGQPPISELCLAQATADVAPAPGAERIVRCAGTEIGAWAIATAQGELLWAGPLPVDTTLIPYDVPAFEAREVTGEAPGELLVRAEQGDEGYHGETLTVFSWRGAAMARVFQHPLSSSSPDEPPRRFEIDASAGPALVVRDADHGGAVRHVWNRARGRFEATARP